MPLIRRAGSTKLLKGPMGGLAGSPDCCCGPVDLCANSAAIIAAFVMDSATITWVAGGGFLGTFNYDFTWSGLPAGYAVVQVEWELSGDGGLTWGCPDASPGVPAGPIASPYGTSTAGIAAIIGCIGLGTPVDVTIRARLEMNCNGGLGGSGVSDWLVGNTTTVPAP